MTNKMITTQEDDELKEITNIGAGNASTALSTMLGKQVKMTVPESFVGGIEEVQRLIGSNDKKVAATFLKFHGEIEGAMVMILSLENSIKFINILTNSTDNNLDQIDDTKKSVLQEVGNILLGASITAINKFLDLNLIHSIPDICIDKLGAIVDSIVIDIGSLSGEILVFKVKISIETDGIESDLYYLFDPASSAKILELTKKKINA